MKRLTRRTILAAAPAVLTLASLPARAKNYGPGVTDSEIKLGNTGPTAARPRPTAPCQRARLRFGR